MVCQAWEKASLWYVINDEKVNTYFILLLKIDEHYTNFKSIFKQLPDWSITRLNWKQGYCVFSFT